MRDIAHPDSEAQAGDVAAVLDELGIDVHAPRRVVEVWNKIDLIPSPERPARFVEARAEGENGLPAVVAVSALTGEGLPELLDAIEQRISAHDRVYEVELAGEALGRLHKLYELGEVLDRKDRSDGADGRPCPGRPRTR